ncbi:MAG TPA: DUF4332 domain-containing protein [Nitrososphaera sp.]|jgi:hypothetical protein|nr:DUF4332 domain-containing protein [Nitrososphaera sp.]
MAVTPDTPVTVIEGIGDATAARLEQANVHFVFDLLRGSIRTVHAAVASLASEAEVRFWRQMASLLQVAEVDAQAAEALVRAGTTSVEELSHKSLDAIEDVFSQAREQGTIPNIYSANQISAMLRDAAVLRHTGTITGTVRNGEGEPVADATVRIGNIEQRSDARGRFRLLRIPLGTSLPLFIAHGDYLPRLIESPNITRDVNTLGVQVFIMEKRADASTPQAPLLSLSEMDGDTLPITSGQRVRTVELDKDKLRPSDILKLSKLYKSVPEAQLVSRFKSFIDGEILIHTLRLPLNMLPAQAQAGDHFLVSNGALVKIRMDAEKLRRYKIRLRLRGKRALRLRPKTVEKIARLLREDYDFLVENGYFSKR